MIERGTTSGLYRSFLESLVAPNADLFANFAMIGELAVGVSLFLGLGTRLGVAGALFLARCVHPARIGPPRNRLAYWGIL